ncbi:putative amidase domain protein [compost metagenome]
MFLRTLMLGASLLLMIITSAVPTVSALDSSTQTETEIKSFLNSLFQLRAEDLANHSVNVHELRSKQSQHAYNVQSKRKTYLYAWADKRNMIITDCESKLRFGKIHIYGDEQVRLTVGHSQKISYAYKNNPASTNWFGLGTWHVLTLRKINNEWSVAKEWFLDPLDENPQKIPPGNPMPAPDRGSHHTTKHYDRKRAVAYANKYAGLAWGSGNDGRYNQKYKNYNHLGGDCTNFASQTLGDPSEGGGLAMNGPWRRGTRTWVQTDAFKNYLVYSGHAKIIAKGNFTELAHTSTAHPYSSMAELNIGDLIAHVMHNDVDHFSIITGFDQRGYPLVNSHSVDRYRAPFDLGWDDETDYLFIHVKD